MYEKYTKYDLYLDEKRKNNNLIFKSIIAFIK